MRPIFTESYVQHFHDAHLARAVARREDIRVRRALRPEHPPSPPQDLRARLRPYRGRI